LLAISLLFTVVNQPTSPLEENFHWVSQRMTNGDVFVVDSSNQCGAAEEWDYLIRTNFPVVPQFLNNPAGYRRVWYITYQSQQNTQLFASVSEGRIPRDFFGPPSCFFQLYEAPPDPVGIPFDNGMRFHGIDIMNGDRPWSATIVRREGEVVRFRLWWSVDRMINYDYTVGTYYLRANETLPIEISGSPHLIYPEGASSKTSEWVTGNYYVEEREMKLPFPAPRTTYPLAMDVYLDEAGIRVPAPGVDQNIRLLLAHIKVMAY
jgi:hypothetical protein